MQFFHCGEEAGHPPLEIVSFVFARGYPTPIEAEPGPEKKSSKTWAMRSSTSSLGGAWSPSTVEVDPVRGPLMAWAFEAYATGDWTIRSLLAELTRRGLTTVPGPRSPARPLRPSHLHTLLRHPYYVGTVRYQGVLYPGKHERLVDYETWQRVQELLTAKHLAGEKHREHPHYLKGSIFCGQCGSRLIVCHAKGRGGTYSYFICIGRQQKRTDCTQRAIRIEQAEAAIAAYYATVQLPEDELVAVRAFLEEELSVLRFDTERERKAQERRLRNLEGERKKLLEAHYADAVPLDLLKSEQARLTGEIESAESRLAEIEADFQKAESNLKRALTRAGDCQAAYCEAVGPLRRQFNLAFFKRLLIDDECNVKGELAEPFDALLGDDLRRAAAVRPMRSYSRRSRTPSGSDPLPASSSEATSAHGSQNGPSWARDQHHGFLGVVVLVRNFWCRLRKYYRTRISKGR
ncbi:MAG TPA: recombinase zinc beta ribbon domain-containing protein [Solirubrobacteraceae bacterium]|nr:recombinase zinc beta ribbon domain-containing protein [Solirubrobacteraceae bacterium]